MDCEKFENLLIDELYGELDEVTSAAVRRHAAGCARCGALLSGLRATRKVAALPMEEPSTDLEDRILSAVREQQKVLPFRARFAMGLSRAGAWAMRPQTAMAAVFLVVIGTSFVLVQSRKTASLPAAAFNAEGAPVAAKAVPQAAASAYALEAKESNFAHGLEEKKLAMDEQTTETPSPMATAAPSLALGGATIDGIVADESKDKSKALELGSGHYGESEAANAAPIAGAGRDGDFAANRGAASGGGGAPGEQGWAAHAEAQGAAAPTFQAAKQAYDARDYSTARSRFDQLAASDPTASLWAGRAEEKANGCTAAAIQRYESARTRAPSGSAVANDATMAVAQCYRTMGNTALARARLSTLLGQPGYAQTAQNELDQLSPAVARKAAAHESPAPSRIQATQPAQAAPKADAQKAAGY